VAAQLVADFRALRAERDTAKLAFEESHGNEWDWKQRAEQAEAERDRLREAAGMILLEWSNSIAFDDGERAAGLRGEIDQIRAALREKGTT
jgi:hypothetical protein